MANISNAINMSFRVDKDLKNRLMIYLESLE